MSDSLTFFTFPFSVTRTAKSIPSLTSSAETTSCPEVNFVPTQRLVFTLYSSARTVLAKPSLVQIKSC